MYFCLCVYARASSALFSVTFVVRVVLSEKEKKKKTFSRKKIYNPLFRLHRRRRRRRHFCFASITLFLSLRRGKKGPFVSFSKEEEDTTTTATKKQSSFGSKERDFECFVVWFSLSTSSIQNSGANKKSYTYSIVLEKGPLDTHHGASFLGPRTVDAV